MSVMVFRVMETRAMRHDYFSANITVEYQAANTVRWDRIIVGRFAPAGQSQRISTYSILYIQNCKLETCK
jgi:hypothetical protein